MQTEVAALLLSIVHLSLAALSAGHALLYKREPRAAIGWIAISLGVPFLGPIAYYMFGVNRVRTTAAAYRQGGMIGFERPQRLTGATGMAERAGPLATVGATVGGDPLLAGNAIRPLYNGEQTYAEMLGAICAAEHYVNLATYIFETGQTGREFVEALAAAAERGVDVRVLIDGVGQHYSFPTARRLLRRAGVRARLFLPPRLLPPSLHVNLRNHRKILVVDGSVGFTGGMNLGRRHMLGADGERRTNDVHFMVRGPVVAELDQAFCRDWYFVTRQTLAVAATGMQKPGGAACRVIVDGPDENMDRLAMVIQGVVSAARRRVAIMTPYFLPSRELIAALQAAASRGVRVTVILPATNNLPFVHWATRNMLWELLLWDIEVVYQPPPFNHAKLLVVDDDYALIGSANIDPRSLRLNFELGVEVFERPFVEELDGYLAAGIVRGHAAAPEGLPGRPLWQRVRDAVFWLFSPYL